MEKHETGINLVLSMPTWGKNKGYCKYRAEDAITAEGLGTLLAVSSCITNIDTRLHTPNLFFF